jgi:hypothetical protein
MNKLILNPTEDTPKIVLDTDNNEYLIEGRSLPENAVSFYTPIFEWLKNFRDSQINNLTLNIKLDYFNTASAKQITKILMILQGLSEEKNIKINWYYYIEDTDIKSSGARFAKLIDVDIELIPYED